ncbi:MAG TPA: flagellar M-ring protein FliF C-terminal domain-containing protein [Tepidisphaeraceae bacterium]|nr:flagellar M-ring protein FliF C-terminal domain-containing protein [Tepidisphaeraceae bacterium]
MDTLKAQWLRIQQQLSGLTASQKMLTASLVAIMVMTVLWWARFAGTAEMTPLLDQSLPPADVGQVQSALLSHGINSTIVGDRIMVPTDRRFEALATLAYNNGLPSNLYAAWDEMVKQMSPWDSTSKTASLQIHMKERLLGDMLATLPGVKRAIVTVNATNERRVGGSIEPSASVLIASNGDINSSKLVTAAAATVSSAIAGLTRSHVSVVIDGASYQGKDPNSDFVGGDIHEELHGQEKQKSETIRGMLPPGSLVAVAMKMEISSKTSTHTSYNPNESLIKEQDIDTENQENNQTPAAPAAEPGVASNSGLSLNSGPTAQASQTNTTEKNRTKMFIGAGKTDETIVTPGGSATVISAAVRIPRSYFVRELKSQDASGKEPDEAAIQAQVAKELPSFRSTVRMTAGMPSDENLSIDTYYDSDGQAMASVTEAASASGMSAMVGGHAKEVALGVLAIISLFMVSMIVKKSSPAPAIAVEAPVRETPHLAGLEDVAGIAADNSSTLDAMEVDDDSVKSQQMVEQVSTMVKENPDAAANLVKRWLNRT